MCLQEAQINSRSIHFSRRSPRPSSHPKQTMLKRLTLLTAVFVASSSIAAEPATEFIEHISALTNNRSGSPLKLKKGEAAITKAMFKPPVEILISAKTDSTNLRLSYAANQVIFNWEVARHELRIDGGPAGGKHKPGAGVIPTNRYVTVRWLVTPKNQQIFVDNALRFEHSGDYSRINAPVGVVGAAGSEITVKSIKVKQLPPGTE